MERLLVSFPDSLAAARLVERPNRFLVRCRLEMDQSLVEAHLPDPGRLRELLVPDARVWLEPAEGGSRRTSWTVLLVQVPGEAGLVSVDTRIPNLLIAAALRRSLLQEFRGWRLGRREVPLGESRIDFQLENSQGKPLALEVKSVTWVENGVGLFPDAVTARGSRHLRELAALVRSGKWEAAVLFVVQRSDARRVLAARHIDAHFAETLRQAQTEGVRILARTCHVSLQGVRLGRRIPAG